MGEISGKLAYWSRSLHMTMAKKQLYVDLHHHVFVGVNLSYVFTFPS